MSNKKDKINEVNLMKNGMKAKIIAYRKYEDIDVEFEDGYIYHTIKVMVLLKREA